MSTAPPRADVEVFLPSLHGGGAERAMLNLLAALRRRGVAAGLVLARAEGAYLREVPGGVPITDLGAGRTAAALVPLARHLRARPPRALLSTLSHANVVAVAARALARAPTRVVLREANMVSQKARDARTLRARLLPALMRRAYPKADALVAVSASVADDLSATLGLPRHRIAVVHSPIVTSALHDQAREAPGHLWFAPGEPPVVLGVGRLTRQKDFGTLLDAFAIVRRRTEARLLILGEGEERPALERQAVRLGIAKHVALPGFVPDPFPMMARAGVFVLSSAWEGLPNALVQAMALGTPVVATDGPGGTSEVLRVGEAGALVPVGDAAALADAVCDALAKPPDPAPARKAAARFDADAVAEAYLHVLFPEGA